MPIGFGKALEIRQDPNANRGKWVEPIVENVKHAVQHPIDTLEQSSLGQAASGDTDALTNLLMGFGGVGAMKVVGKSAGLTGMVQKYEQQFGVPVKQWNRDQMLEFKAAKDLESGAAEKALAKESPKTSRAFKETLPEPAEEMTPIGEDMPPDPSKMKSPGLAKMKAMKAQPASEAEALAQIESEPRNVIAETLGGTKPAPRRAPPKQKAVQAPIDTTKGMQMEGMPSTGHAQIKDNWVRNEGNVKEEAFKIYEGKTGKPREEWSPEDLQAARDLVQERLKVEEYAKKIQKPAQYWNKRDVDGYLSYKQGTPLDELLNPPNKMSAAEAFIGKPTSEWTGADQLRWTKHQLESE